MFIYRKFQIPSVMPTLWNELIHNWTCMCKAQGEEVGRVWRREVKVRVLRSMLRRHENEKNLRLKTGGKKKVQRTDDPSQAKEQMWLL